MILDKNASVARLTADSDDSDKEAYVAVDGLGNVKINIQPADAELTAVADGVFGQTFQAFVSVSGIKIGDRITVSGSNIQYLVKGVRDWYFAPLPHVELVLFEGDS